MLLSFSVANAGRGNEDPFEGKVVTVNLGTRPCLKKVEGSAGNSRTFWACELKPGDPGEPPAVRP